MKASIVTSFKLGVFVVALVAALAIIAFALGIHTKSEDKIVYTSYFDESVVGLDVGAPVKYRGITIGAVEHVGVGPGGRLVEVRSGVRESDAWLLAWRPQSDNGLRAQVSATGITGIKLVNIDYLDPKTNPPPVLPFPAPSSYVPAAPSFLGTLQDRALVIADDLVKMLERVEKLVAGIGERDLPARFVSVLASVEDATTELRATLHRFGNARIPERVVAALDQVDATLGAAQAVIHRVASDGGVLSGAELATRTVSGVGLRAARTSAELDKTLRDLGAAARSVQSLADALERDPDMLLKGRAPLRE